MVFFNNGWPKIEAFFFVKGIKPDKCTSSAQFLVPKANPDHPNPTSPKENNQINNPIQPTQPPPTPKKRNRRTYLTKKKNLIQWRDRTNHSVILQLSNTYFFSFFSGPNYVRNYCDSQTFIQCINYKSSPLPICARN